MTLAAGFFYVFAVLAVGSAAMVVMAKNPVHAVLFLILTFFNSAGLFVLLGAEFIAMLLVIVYVGAVAVLFLFVVMMLDVDFAALRAGFVKNAPVGAIVGGIVLAELVLLFAFRDVTLGPPTAIAAPAPADVTNTAALGRIIYTKYVYFFQGAGMILLVAMIGAIVLTLQHKRAAKRQSASVQVGRRPELAIEVVKVAPGGYTIPAALKPGPAE